MSAVITPAPSALTLGTSGLGRDTEVGSVEEATAVDLVLALLRSDHALLDTSNAYAGGRSEAVIGKALDEQTVLNASLALEERAGFTARPDKWW